MKNTVTRLRNKAKRLDSSAHAESFAKHGFCTIPGCKCDQRAIGTYQRIGKIEMSQTQIDAEREKTMSPEEIAKYWNDLWIKNKKRAQRLFDK